MSNPDWTREETALALDLYLRFRPQLPGAADPDVMELSHVLRKSAVEQGDATSESFRNPAGVAMKIANLSRLDVTNAGAGLPHGSKLEESIWREYLANPVAFTRMIADLRSGQQNQMEARLTPEVWVTGMWGFNPELHGYVGFTTEGPRKKFIDKSAPGALMMVIGQNGPKADPRDVGRVLGLVELDPRPVDESECMSPEEYVRKVAEFGKERWRLAMPALKAWRIGREIRASYVAPQTCSARNARAVGASCLRLQEFEVERVLNLPVTPWRVWGQPEWAADETAHTEVAAKVAVSRGPPPAFGDVTHHREDGENSLYILRLEGCVQRLLPKADLFGRHVVKIGRSNDVKRRVEEFNCGFPPGSDLRWVVRSIQKFKNADDAHQAEQDFLSRLSLRHLAIGKEFAIATDKELDLLLAAVAEKSAFVMSM